MNALRYFSTEEKTETNFEPSVKVDEISDLESMLGIVTEKLEKSIKEISRLRKQLEISEENKILNEAKKEALKESLEKTKKELNELKSKYEILLKNSSTAGEDVGFWKQTSQDYLKNLNSLRKNHVQEIRLLQRAILAQNGSQQFKFSETSDLIERLGRAVLQRDEALREKFRFQTKVQEMREELKVSTFEKCKLVEELKNLTEKMKKIEKKKNFLLYGKGGNSSTAVGEAQNVCEGVGVLVDIKIEENESKGVDKNFEEKLRSLERKFLLCEEGSDLQQNLLLKNTKLVEEYGNLIEKLSKEKEDLKKDLEEVELILESKEKQIEVLKMKEKAKGALNVDASC